MYADLIIKSERIFTATGGPLIAGFVAVCDGRIAAVEQGEPLSSMVGPNTRVYELSGHVVCPGFTDTHCFFIGWALGGIGVDLSAATTINELLATAKAYAKVLSGSSPVLGHGWSDTLHPANTSEMDDVFGSRPALLLSASREKCMMNRAAIERYSFESSSCYPEAMWKLLKEMMGDRDYIVPKFREYMKMLNSRGVTSVKEMGFDDYYGFTDILEELEKAGDLSLRINFMSQPVGANADFVFGQKMRERFKGDYVRFSGYNRMTDGSIGQLCACLKQPYNCRPDSCCIQNIDWNLIRDETLAADAKDFRFSLHAQGDAAIAKVLDIFEACKCDANGRLVNRHIITDLEFSDPADLERMGRLGAVAEIYPQIQSIADREEKLAMIREKIGEERGQYYWNRRKMADSGVIISCATDLPLTVDDIPQSIYHAAGGYFPDGGEPFNFQNMLTREELLIAWCRGGSYNIYREDDLGTLEKGKLADIAVLDGDVFNTAFDRVRDIRVCLTFIGGKPVFEDL